MSRWRIAVVVALLGVPLVVWAGIGSYVLWQRGLGVYVWWPLSSCMMLGYFLLWHWLRKHQLIRPVDFNAPTHWTDRDREAWKLVEARAEAVAKLRISLPNEPRYYFDLGQDMALELAKFYSPGTADPLSARTVPELLAVIELAAHDLADLVDQNVPGGHIMTVRQWQQAKETTEKALGWYRTASNVYWLASAVLSPVDTGLRFAASQLGMARPLALFQTDLVAWFHTAFIHRLGTYLIDLNSGRLKVGATRYRQLTGAIRRIDGPLPSSPPADGTAPVEAADRLTLTVLGQVKMGKSSFVNALLGEQRARTDVLPATAEITRYHLQLPAEGTQLVILDTVGYGHDGPRADQLRATQEAAKQSDVLVLVLHARNPARQADLEMLQALTQWYGQNQDLKMPPFVAVMTQIDLLTPAMEWNPPYDWREPKRPKEVSIQKALTEVRDELGAYLVGAVPVCGAEGKVYGINEWFLPTLAELLGEAKSVALLRCLRAEVDNIKVRKVFQQLAGVGKNLAMAWLEVASKKRTPTAP